MKILIATESYYPNISGVAVFSHNLARKMAQNGHHVEVIAPSPRFSEYEENIAGIHIYRLKSKINKFRDGYFVSQSPFRQVAKIIKKSKPDIVHLQDPALISLAALREARKLDIPIVVTNHFSLEYLTSYLPSLKFIHPLFLFLAKNYLNWFYRRCDLLTCPTKTVALGFSHLGAKTQVEVISNGVDLSRFMPYYGDINLIRRKYNIPLNLPVILYVGRLDIDKDVAVLIKSISRVLAETRAHFLIVGNGKEKSSLLELALQLKIKRNITFIDFIAHESDTLPKIYQLATLLVNPCPRETQSIVVLEAQATGLPVVLANDGALPELVKNGQNGYLFTPGNSDDLARKILLILNDKKRAQMMGHKSLERLEDHVVEKTHARFEKKYQRLWAKKLKK